MAFLVAGCQGQTQVAAPTETAQVIVPSPSTEPATATVEPTETAAPPTETAEPTEEPTEAPTVTVEASSTPIPQAELPDRQAYDMPAGSFPHDVAPAPDGTIWVTLMFKGEMARLDPATGEIRRIWLSGSAAPHGVIVGPDGAAWVTDQGLNAILRIDNETEEVERFPLPASAPDAHLNTATFDNNGILWFTGEAGYYGRLDPATGEMQVWEAPRGQGPYGITTTPSGEVFYASLAGSHIAQINTETGEAAVIEPPTPGQGARRIWSDSQGRVWVSEWNSGQVAVYYPTTGEWREWRLPGSRPSAYAVYVDEQDIVWLTDFGGDAIVRFDPATEQFRSYRYTLDGDVRQLLGRPGEVWGAESATDKVIVIRTGEAEATDG